MSSKAQDQAARAAISDVIEKIVQEIDPPDEQADGAVVVMKHVTLIDILHPDGGRQMYCITADASRQPLCKWDRDGLLRYVETEWQGADDDSGEA